MLAAMMPSPLPSDTRIGAVHLRVAELSPVASFYGEVLGLQVLAEDDATVALAADRQGGGAPCGEMPIGARI